MPPSLWIDVVGTRQVVDLRDREVLDAGAGDRHEGDEEDADQERVRRGRCPLRVAGRVGDRESALRVRTVERAGRKILLPITAMTGPAAITPMNSRNPPKPIDPGTAADEHADHAEPDQHSGDHDAALR